MEFKNKTPATVESVLALIRELAETADRKRVEAADRFNRDLLESRADWKKLMKEANKRIKKTEENLDKLGIRLDKQSDNLDKLGIRLDKQSDNLDKLGI